MSASNAPVTSMERLEFLAAHSKEFSFTMNKTGYTINAFMGERQYYQSAGPLELVDDAINECLYEIFPLL
ncbi:hypothetical protein ACLMYS_003927 [Salmonella enterica]